MVKPFCHRCAGSLGTYRVLPSAVGCFLDEQIPVGQYSWNVSGRTSVTSPDIDGSEFTQTGPITRARGEKYRRAGSPRNADHAKHVRGPRRGPRTFTIIEGRDGLPAARFECTCGRPPRIMGPREIARALINATGDELAILRAIQGEPIELVI